MRHSALISRNEIAQLSLLLSVAFDAGLGVVASVDEVSSRARGTTATNLRNLMKSLELGGNLYEELAALRTKSSDPAADELLLKLQTALQFGTPIASQLAQLARTNRAFVAQQRLSLAAKRENLMLLPLVFLILPVTVLFAVYPSLQYLQLNK